MMLRPGSSPASSIARANDTRPTTAGSVAAVCSPNYSLARASRRYPEWNIGRVDLDREFASLTAIFTPRQQLL